MSGTFKVEFETSNDAFYVSSSQPGDEIARILRTLAYGIADDLDSGINSGSVIDANGNKVGTWGVE